MTDTLLPCPQCARHVRAHTVCPFCPAGSALSVRPSRGTATALAALATLALGVGCDRTERTDRGVAPVYGAPPPPGLVANRDAGPDANTDAAPTTP